MGEYLKIVCMGLLTCVILRFVGCSDKSNRPWPSHEFFVEVIKGSESNRGNSEISNSSFENQKAFHKFEEKDSSPSFNLFDEFTHFIKEKNPTANTTTTTSLIQSITNKPKENSNIKHRYMNTSKSLSHPEQEKKVIKNVSPVLIANAELPYKPTLKNVGNDENTKFFIKDSTESHSTRPLNYSYGNENFSSTTSVPFVSFNFANLMKYPGSSKPAGSSIKGPNNFKSVPLKKYTTQILTSALPTKFSISPISIQETTPMNKIPVRLILSDPSSVKVKLKGAPNTKPPSEEIEENWEETKIKGVLFKIWKIHEGTLKLEFEQFVPHRLIEGFNYTNGDILNLNQVPPLIQQMVQEQSSRINRRVGFEWEPFPQVGNENHNESNMNIKEKQTLLNYVVMDDEKDEDPDKDHYESIINKILNELKSQPEITATDRFSVMNQIPLNLYNKQDSEMTTKDKDLITTLLISLLKEKNEKIQQQQQSLSSNENLNYLNQIRPQLNHPTTPHPNHHVTQHPLILSYPPIYSQYPQQFPHQYPLTPYAQMPIFPTQFPPTKSVKPPRSPSKNSDLSPEDFDDLSEDYDDFASTKATKATKKRKKAKKKKTNKLLKLFDIDKFNFNFDFGFDVFSILKKVLAVKLVPLALIMVSSIIPLLPLLFWKWKKLFKTENPPHLHQYYYPIYSTGNKGWDEWDNGDFQYKKQFNYGAASNTPLPFFTTLNSYNSKSSTETSSEKTSPFGQSTPMLGLNNPLPSGSDLSTTLGNLDLGQLSQESLKFDYWKPFLPGGIDLGNYRDSLSKSKQSSLYKEGFKIGTKLGNLGSKENVEALKIILEDKKDKVKDLLNKYNLAHLNLPALIGRKEDSELTTEKLALTQL